MLPMEAAKKTILQIFVATHTLEVPFFQRKYIWAEENWERFLDDMSSVSEENKEYFLGSIITKKQDDDVKSIIDGQQRLTTLTIFFKVLYDIHHEEKRSFLKTIDDELIISHNYHDRKVYESILIGNIEDISDEQKDTRIFKCYDYFKTKSDKLEKIDHKKILKKVYFVGIELDGDEDEQEIFDTLNSLGVSLTTAELLKNELYSRYEESFFKDTWQLTFESDDNKDYWSQKITGGRQRRENIDFFLQSFLIIEKAEKANENLTDYISTSSIYKNYKKFIQDGKKNDVKFKHAFINNLIDEAKLYKNIINPEYLEQAVTSPIERINLIVFGLNTTTVIPYLLYLRRNVKNEDEFDKMISLIENYLIRRLICKEKTNRYNNFFAELIKDSIKSYNVLSDKLLGASDTDKFPNDEQFKDNVLNVKLSNQQAKVFLYLLESYFKKDLKMAMQLKGMRTFSLEHIMPKKWKTHWKKYEEYTDEKRDELIMTLGNLTILPSSLNAAIQNSSWKNKKKGDSKKRKLGLEEYSKGITIFDHDDYLGSDDWNEYIIIDRAEFLARKSLKVWPYPKNL